MPARFVLDVETDKATRAARLRLTGPAGELLGEHQVRLDAHPPARWEGLFETRRYIRRMARDRRQAEVLLDTVGAFLGRSVLGTELTRAVAGGEPRRTLLVRLAGAESDPVAAAFGRVPWELARIEGDLRTLRQRNVAVRVTPALDDEASGAADAADAGDAPVRCEPAPGEPLRILVVLAEPGGARPAGARLEREELIEAFFRDILPHRDVEVDVLCHAVTRARLWEQVRGRRGYHLVHWSGRARAGGLEIELDEGEEEDPCITGAELADLLSGSGAGEVTPALVFLSASRAGTLGSARDWDAVRVALGEPTAAPAPGSEGPTLDEIVASEGGNTGVGLALVAAGIPAVVALRHEVAPSYARRLAMAFYRQLLAGDPGLPVDDALAAAQREFDGAGAPVSPAVGAAGAAAAAAVPVSAASNRGSVLPGAMMPESALDWGATPASGSRRPASDPGPAQDPGRPSSLRPPSPSSPPRLSQAIASSPRPSASGLEAPSSGHVRTAAEPWHADPLDQAAPLLLGAARVQVSPAARRSAQADRREPAPHPLLEDGSKELDPLPGFVGRGAELGRLARHWLGPEAPPVALVEGPAGVGKTSLAAEAIHLWHRSFGLVLAFQARPAEDPAAGAGSEGSEGSVIEPLLRTLDRRLRAESAAYRARCEQDQLAGLYWPPGAALGAEERAARLLCNLGEVLAGERALLVLDGLQAAPEGDPAEDPAHEAWVDLVAQLGEELRGSEARVLVTCRHSLFSERATPAGVLRVELGALPMGHAAVLADRRSALREILYRGTRERREGGGDAGQAERLARRVLEASHGHPLVLLRLGDVASMGRPVLDDALDRLGSLAEGSLPPGSLPGGRGEAGRARALLEDAAACLFDLLLERLSPEARRLLWGMSLADEPVPAWMIEDLGATLLPGEERPRAGLAEICAAGLAVREEEQARGTVYAFHRLVAERVGAWMDRHPEERGPATPEDVNRCYGERYAGAFRNALPMLQQGSLRRRRELCAELGRRSVRYLVRGRAFQALSHFATSALTGVGDAALLADILADLAAAADHGAGSTRWRARVSLADALRGARDAEIALPLYERAEAEAEAGDHWSDVGVIRSKWAAALSQSGRLEQARRMYEESAAAKRRAGKPLVSVLGAEIDALRVDVLRGDAAGAWDGIEERLAALRGFWERSQAGEEVPEAPDEAALASTFASALDAARRAAAALERWSACLARLEELERVDRSVGATEHELMRERFHRWTPLTRLGRTEEAAEVIEVCLEGFRRARDTRGEVRALSAMASVRAAQGAMMAAVELEREALAARERFANPGERAGSHRRVASFLHRAGIPGEAAEHALAAVVYQLASGQDARAELRDLAGHAAEAGAVPRLAAQLERPVFTPLRRFLGERGVSLDGLQARVEDMLPQPLSAAERAERWRGAPVSLAEEEAE